MKMLFASNCSNNVVDDITMADNFVGPGVAVTEFVGIYLNILLISVDNTSLTHQSETAECQQLRIPLVHNLHSWKAPQ